MAIKKSELYSSLWKSCDELRGSMDASQYKDYVLVLLFVCFWARGFFVSTVGKDEAVIREYIKRQEKEDQRIDQLNLIE